MPRGEFLHPGDVVRIGIACVGTLENSVADGVTRRSWDAREPSARSVQADVGNNSGGVSSARLDTVGCDRVHQCIDEGCGRTAHGERSPDPLLKVTECLVPTGQMEGGGDAIESMPGLWTGRLVFTIVYNLPVSEDRGNRDEEVNNDRCPHGGRVCGWRRCADCLWLSISQQRISHIIFPLATVQSGGSRLPEAGDAHSGAVHFLRPSGSDA